MPQRLLLEGGREFGGGMSVPDLRGIELAGGFNSAICIIPTAAAPDQNHKRAGANGVRWFQSLGAKNVFTVDVIDKPSADNSSYASIIRNSKLIYLLGGFPRYLAETLADSQCWQAALAANKRGAVIAGSSAGAMVLCEYYYDPYEKKLMRGLNLLPNACVLPHHNNFGKAWAKNLISLLPKATLIGIDEETGALCETKDEWQTYGAGNVTLYRNAEVKIHTAGEAFNLGFGS